MCIQRSVRTHMPANRFTFILCISPVHIQPSPGGMWPVRVRHSIRSRSCYISACGLSLFSLLIFSRLTVFPPSTCRTHTCRLHRFLHACQAVTFNFLLSPPPVCIYLTPPSLPFVFLPRLHYSHFIFILPCFMFVPLSVVSASSPSL